MIHVCILSIALIINIFIAPTMTKFFRGLNGASV